MCPVQVDGRAAAPCLHAAGMCFDRRGAGPAAAAACRLPRCEARLVSFHTSFFFSQLLLPHVQIRDVRAPAHPTHLF
jgi:hypothetical protein